ncbi:MAG: hypothetical protein ABR509_04285 [Candidatus Limnocylindria bacterium]
MTVAGRVLLPQYAGRAKSVRTGAEWLFEPYWNGERLLGFVRGGAVHLTDPGGARVDRSFPDAIAALRAGVQADDAVIDAVWAQSWIPAEGATDGRPLLIALDLLVVDGQELLDIPLLERRRLLEAIVAESDVLRVTPAVRAPLGPQFAIWRAQGFRASLAKHANSRYLAGERNEEWVRIAIDRVRQPGMLDVMFGRRDRDSMPEG